MPKKKQAEVVDNSDPMAAAIGQEKNAGSEPVEDNVVFENENPLALEDPGSEQSVEENVDTNTPDQSTQEPIYSDDELKAIQSGWTPKEAFLGDPSKWKPAEEWNKRSNFQSLIDVQREEIAQMKRSQNEILQMMRDERSNNAKIQLSSLEKEKEEAITNADLESVKKLDAKIDNLKGLVVNSSAPAANSAKSSSGQEDEIPKEVIEFGERNKWFNGTSDIDQRKTNYAKFLEKDLHNKNPNMSLSKVMRNIENEVSKTFDSQQKNVAPVEIRRSSMNPNPTNSKGLKYDNLPVEAKRFVEYYAEKAAFQAKRNNKAFDKDQYRQKYIKQLIQNDVLDASGRVLDKSFRR